MQQLLVNRNIGAAPVGSSMHQWGLALDFGCDRKSYSTSGAKCQNWMRANAGRFGFYNLPSEAWHYSTNGR
jgi:LAS superfamily LD-carboxypeptidase LdcB